jgi:hypothetical protein
MESVSNAAFQSCGSVSQVGYCNPNWKKVDYIIDIFGTRMGVSVTRAMSYPNPGNFSEDDARRLLYKKLYGLVSHSTS